MCYVIYIGLLGLAIYYSDHLLEQYMLSVAGGSDTTITVALGWELVAELWPVFFLFLVIGSAVTYFTMRLIYSSE